MELLSVVGARPQFVKLGPVARACDRMPGIQHRIVHTGQHYDERMSGAFFADLGLPEPEVNLEVGSGDHGWQTGTMLCKLEQCFVQRRPDVVLVYGDTNSTAAAVLAATKLHVPVVHIEAGLRSFDRRMPEEINRLVADHCSDRLYAPTPAAMQNLATENLAHRAMLSGDVMHDAVLHNVVASRKSLANTDLRANGGREFVLLTIHRPSNTTPDVLIELLSDLDRVLGGRADAILPMHPRTRAVLETCRAPDWASIRVVDPVPYLEMLQLVESAAIVITDSGGVQKEAAFLGTPCITLRDETEWIETVDLGVNRLVGRNSESIEKAVDAFISGETPFQPRVVAEINRIYGGGEAASRIVTDIVNRPFESN